MNSRRCATLLVLIFMTSSEVAAQAVKRVIPDAARPLPLSAVRLTAGPLKRAQDLDKEYLLKLEPDRMLAYYRERAGLKPKAEPYGGWDGPGRNLTGHIAGHYLSGASLMFAATGDTRFKERVDYIVQELKKVQDAHGDGYLGALEHGKERMLEVSRGEIRSASFDLNGLWSPFYVFHKTFAGLRDAYRYTGNRTALELETKFAAWVEKILSGLDGGQMQRVLNTEFGGMNEVLVDLYEDTGDKRWLELSYRFEHKAVLDPLKRHQDPLPGIHGNTQVPKLIGSLARFALTGDPGDGIAASSFWDRVVQYHSYATGGHGKDEYFGPPGQLSDRVDGRTAETCNVYNMLKLTRKLFALRPDPHYVEFHERALFNHILASIDPENGETCYMVPVGRGVRREYQDLFRRFTCCIGTGMESHALHGDGIYYESGDRFWVNLYAPSTARWEAAGLDLTVDTDFPEGDSATLRLKLRSPREFTLALRRPGWAEKGFAVKENGEEVKDLPEPMSYVELKRTWKTGDSIEVRLPKELRVEPLPDNPRRVALMWGPLVLAGDLGTEEDFPSWKPGAVPVLVAAEQPLTEWLRPAGEKAGDFRTEGVGRESDVELKPFYRLHRRAYSVYWDVLSSAEWEKRAAEIAAERERQRKLDLATVGFVQPGDEASEKVFNQQGEQTRPCRMMGRPCRRGQQWFSYDLPVDPSHPITLVVSYYSDEWRKRTFEILVDDQRVGQQEIEKGPPPHFFDVEYRLPTELVKGKQKVTVRFQAVGDSELAAVYGVRTVRADAER